MAFIKTEPIAATASSIGDLQPADQEAAYVICKSPDKLKRLITMIDQHEHIHFLSDGDWSCADLVISLLSKYNPAELFFSTYALRETQVRQLILAMDRKELLSVQMLIDYRASRRTPEVIQLASFNMTRIFLTSIHAKVTVLRSAAASITIVGSANWTSNPRIEAGVISRDPKVAGFHINWMEKVMNNAEVFK